MLLRGTLLMQKGEADRAKTELEAAITVDPSLSGTYLALAELQLASQNVDRAVATLKTGLGAAKEKSGLRLALATLLERRGEVEDAIAVYETYLAEQPGALVAVNNLASLLSDHRTDQASLDRASTLAAVLRDAPTPAFRETYGWALVRSGKVKDGLRQLEQTINDLATNPFAQFHIGKAYALERQKDLATKHLKLALETGAAGTLKQQVEAELAALEKAPQQ
jgi:tetratricopeptide (TPR) repeat protein